MAGIGIKLNRIYSKNTIATNLMGFGYSTVITIAPMFLVIAAVIIMQILLGFSSIGYAQRELYSCTVLYIFVFALLTASPCSVQHSVYLSVCMNMWWARWISSLSSQGTVDIWR